MMAIKAEKKKGGGGFKLLPGTWKAPIKTPSGSQTSTPSPHAASTFPRLSTLKRRADPFFGQAKSRLFVKKPPTMSYA